MTVAGAAGGGAGSGLGAAALAVVAMHKSGDADRRLLAAEGVFQRDFEVVTQIAAAAWAGLLRTAAAHRAEHLLEDVGKAAGEPPAKAEIAGAAAAVLERGVAVAVIGRALLIVLQDVIGFADVLELLLGGVVAGIAVRVILHRELAVSPLQFIGISRFRDTKDLVKVLLRHSSSDARPRVT